MYVLKTITGTVLKAKSWCGPQCSNYTHTHTHLAFMDLNHRELAHYKDIFLLFDIYIDDILSSCAKQACWRFIQSGLVNAAQVSRPLHF